MLVVGVNSDETVRRLKGPDRPVSPAGDRAAVVAAIGCVEYVTIFEDDTPIHLFEAVRPDIYVKGGDYDADTLPERLAVECYGGRVVTVGYFRAVRRPASSSVSGPGPQRLRPRRGRGRAVGPDRDPPGRPASRRPPGRRCWAPP